MNITKVKYERLFPVGAYLNEKIGFEADVEDGEAMRVIDDLRKLAEYAHKEKYPHFYEEGIMADRLSDHAGLPMNGTISSPQATTATLPKNERIQSFIATINMCTSLKFLENFRARVEAEDNDELSIAYTTKHHELENKLVAEKGNQ